eukprot:16438534-Heterocapsa_arctica.AAC.1
MVPTTVTGSSSSARDAQRMPAKSSNRAMRTGAVAAPAGWGRSSFRRAVCGDLACGGGSREEVALVRDDPA